MRCWDALQRLLAFLTLVALSPLCVALAVAVRLDSRGPIIFQQRRPGRHGAEFMALKFRTMSVGSERATALGTRSGDPRITRVGGVLRSTKLDELPQLWNIVRGDMRFVGPRPIPYSLNEALATHIPGFETRYSVTPGLTSLAQVCVTDNGLDDRLVQDWSRRFEAELRYIKNRCVSYDIAVIVLTAMYVVRKAVSR